MKFALAAASAGAVCGTAWLLSVGAVTQQNRHIAVTVMEMVVGPETWMRMRKFALVASLTAACGLLWANWGPFLRATAHMERSGSAFNPPLTSYLKVMIIVALVLYALQLIANLLRPAPAMSEQKSSDLDQPAK